MDLSFLVNQERDIVVTFVTQANDGFGYGDDGEQVFIPRALIERFGIGHGDIVRCKTVRNDPKFQDRCPWRAYHVSILQKDTPKDDVVEDDEPAGGGLRRNSDQIILDALEQVEMLSTADVATLLGTDANHVRFILDRLHRQRQVVRADIYVNADQKKASRIMWGIGDHIFQPLQVENQNNG